MNRLRDGKEAFAFRILTAYLWIGALAAGYFYEVSFLALDALLFAAAAVCLWRIGSVRITLLHGFLTAFAGLYWISCFYAVDREAALLEAARVTNILPVALLVSVISAERKWALMKQWAWIGAFLTVWGWAFQLFRDGRLESTLGYANVLAMLLAAGIWTGWKAYREKGGSMYVLLVVIQFAGLLQTGSRAVLALFILGSLWMLFERSDRVRNRRVWLYAAGGAVWFVVAALLSMGTLRRLTEWGWNSPEFQLRRIYWSDGLQLLGDVWYKGLGGGGWAILHPGGYFVKYVHQFYLQAALDVGIWGSIFFVVMIGVLVYRAVRAFREVPGRGRADAAPVLLLTALFAIHAAFDIDFVFPLCFGYFLIMLSMLEDPDPVKIAEVGKDVSSVRIAMVAACLIGAIGFGWIAVGYGMKSIGVRAASNEKWNQSVGMLETSGRMLPWAHSVHFELANSYAVQGNKTGDKGYYASALREIEKAVRSLPEYKVYQRTMNSLLKAGK
jgi:hypothetical protein